MTEKEAIEKLHNEKKQELISVLRTFRREGIENFVITRKEIIDTVLKALEQKDKEIQELKEDNQHQWDERCKLTFEIEKKDKEIQELKADLYECNNIISDYIDTVKEKDKIIDLMANFMNKRSWKEHQVKDDDCYCCKVEYSSEECEKCIVEYFKKKAREENV